MAAQPAKKSGTTYGSDQHGLIWGYHFVPGQAARPLTSEAATERLAKPDFTQGNDFLWLHFSLSNTASLAWLRQNLNLPDAFYEALESAVGSSRVEQDDDALVAVVHDVLFDFGFDASEVATASLCVGSQFLISARLRPLRSLDRLRADTRSGQAFRSPVDLLAQLLRVQAGVLVDILRQATVRVDGLEDRLLANRISVSRTELGQLRRVLVRLQRLLAPEPAAFFRLLSRSPGWVAPEDLQDLRQAAEEFSVAVGDSAALVERVKLLQEELTALVSEQSNRTLFVLTFVTVLILPINVVAGLFGMNVGGIPLAERPYGFLWIAGTLLLLTGLLAYLVLGRKRD